jgi:hypothetical protein
MTASNLALVFKASARASRCGWRNSDLCFGPLMGYSDSLGHVQCPDHATVQGIPAYCPALFFFVYTLFLYTSLRDRRPQPHAANWRLPPTRLELTMLPV